jgi:hypothetical protein
MGDQRFSPEPRENGENTQQELFTHFFFLGYRLAIVEEQGR